MQDDSPFAEFPLFLPHAKTSYQGIQDNFTKSSKKDLLGDLIYKDQDLDKTLVKIFISSTCKSALRNFPKIVIFARIFKNQLKLKWAPHSKPAN